MLRRANLWQDRVEEEKILPKKALLRQGLHLPDQHSTFFKNITAGLANVSKSLSSFPVACPAVFFFSNAGLIVKPQERERYSHGR